MKQVLIVEDDAMIGRIYAGLLRKEGMSIEIALDGEQALESIKQRQPDLILLDVMLPKLNGLEVLKRIRDQESFRKTPVIVFSNAELTAADDALCNIPPTLRLRKCQTAPKVLVKTILEFLNRTSPSTSSVPEEQAELLRGLNGCLQQIARAPGISKRVQEWDNLTALCARLTAAATQSRHADLAWLCRGLDGLARSLLQRPEGFQASTLQTVAQAIDLLSVIAEPKTSQARPTGRLVMAIDDDPVSRQAVCSPLPRYGLHPIEMADPKVALQVMELNRFDLVFLDIEMPGMSGHDVCQSMRASGRNQQTPVIFVTSFADCANRASSFLRGGNDLIAKPFLGSELALKAITQILRQPSVRNGSTSSAGESSSGKPPVFPPQSLAIADEPKTFP